jgi:hypothetical protein
MAPQAGISALAIPDAFIGESHMAAAEAVLDRVIGMDNIQLAYVSGSLAAGLGHGMSDVDIYVALNDGVPADLSYKESGFMVQINPVSAEQVKLITEVCAEYTDTATNRRQTNMAEDELKRPLRYAIGTVIIDRCGTLPTVKDSILTIRRVLMNRHAYLLSGFAEDVLGALKVHDRLLALQASQMGVEHALECALAGVGDVYLGRKFLLRRCARASGLRDVLDDGWAYLRQPGLPGSLDEVSEFAVQRMLFATHLVACCLLEGWDEPVDLIPRFEDRRAEGGPLRSPWVTPVRFADSWGMAGPAIGYRTTAAMVRLWRALDGQPVDAIHRRLADASVQVSRELLDSAILQLVETNVAVPGSESML